MNISCSAEPCPVILDCSCVFYSGANLIYTGIVTNDTLCAALYKIDQKFKDAAIGYVFQNGIIQAVPGGPVKLGGTLTQDTVITSGSYTFALTGTIESTAFITTGGTNLQFVKGDGTLDTTSYQPVGNYITDLTGDGTASGPGSAVFTLSNSGVIANTYGSSTQVPVITVDAKGRVTNITNTTIASPSQLLLFSGDVSGAGTTGSNVTLTLATVNSNVYATNTFLKFAVNGKGLVTSATPVVSNDIITTLGYTPVPDTRTLTINGVTYDLSANRSWSITAGVSSVSATSPITSSGGATPNISTSMTSGRLIGRASAGTGVFEEITLGTGLSLSGATLNATANITPAALSRTNDTNVTITLTGSPTTALLQAVTLVAGWTGTLADSRIASASTWNGKQDALNGVGFVKAFGTTISYDNSTYTPTSRNLTINGTTYNLSADRTWTINSLPSQTGHAGQWLTTNGTTASWASLPPSGVSAVTATSPLFSSLGATPDITIQQSSGSQDGYLSSTDWNTFNGKANVNPTSTFIPYNDAGTFEDSYLINDTASSILKTNYSGTDKGIYLDFANNEYYLGDTNYFVKVDTSSANTIISTLSGTATEMVVADASGVLSRQPIPSGTSPLTTKGDIYTYDTTDARLGVGSNGQVLIADDSTATGLTWGTVTGFTRSINPVSSDTTAGSAANTDYVYLVSDTTTITLPTAVGNTNLYTIKRVGTHTVSIATTSGETIDDSTAPITINIQYVSLDLISDGISKWYII